MPDFIASQQHHTIPRWLLENFVDREGMLHVARRNPRTFFKSNPRNVFRRRDYYAAKKVGESLEDQTAKFDTLAVAHVTNLLHMAQRGIDNSELSCVKTMADDVRACGLFLSHLGYRSPQWMGNDFFSGFGELEVEAKKAGKDTTTMIAEENMQLVRSGEFVLVVSEANAPTFVVGDCGPFISRDTELGIDNKKRKADDPNWTPAEQRMWMALSPKVALGVAVRETDARLLFNVLPDAPLTAAWVDHFNEVCAMHSEMIAGVSEQWVCAASRKAWQAE